MKVKGYTRKDGIKVKSYNKTIKNRADRGKSKGLKVNAHKSTIKRKASRNRNNYYR